MAKFREETQHGDEEIGGAEEYSDESDGDSYGKLDGVATAIIVIGKRGKGDRV
jgi:hypothetical protein